MLAHCLQNANYFRFRLSQLGNVKLVAQEEPGPSVGFKIYNPEWVQDPRRSSPSSWPAARMRPTRRG